MERYETTVEQDYEREHAAMIRQTAPESMVLLEHDGTLPVKFMKKIALYGAGVRHPVKGGAGSGDVNVRHFLNVEEACEQAGLTVLTKKWLDRYDRVYRKRQAAFRTEKQAALKKAPHDLGVMLRLMPTPQDYDIPLDYPEEADLTVYVLTRNSGEANDRQNVAGDIQLTPEEVRDIITLSAQSRRFVLVLNVGGFVDLTPIQGYVHTILLASQLGMATGTALVDVLLGKSYPSGKLTMTWAPLENYPVKHFGEQDNTDYTEGINVGYRYFAAHPEEAAYQFGYGRSYTDFEINARVTDVAPAGITVEATVKNIGIYPGKEVIQAYVTKPETEYKMAAEDLIGFMKTPELAPGEVTIVTLFLPIERLAMYDSARAAKVLVNGPYVLAVGNSAAANPVARIYLDRMVVLEQLHPLSSAHQATVTDQTFEYDMRHDDIRLPKYYLRAEDFTTRTVEPPVAPEELPAAPQSFWEDVVVGNHTLDDFIAGLSADQLCQLAVGNYDDSLAGSGFVGNAATTVAGAAGQTTRQLRGSGVPSLVMADGPAGLRLSTVYTIDNKGNAQAVTPSFGGDHRHHSASRGKKYYQWTTALPIGTAVAQTWNPAIARQYGDIVGDEMTRLGVHLWLAPALNIQRSPLDGRNFEYYSEDPLLSGLIAAGITAGVQDHPGCGVTLKHFVANNQETNRMYSSSNMSERTLREIYLRGFEVAVKAGKPAAVMTAYNLVNGQHAAASSSLVTTVLRAEWSFTGMVMTDWFSTASDGQVHQHPAANAAACVAAGTNLIMPGTPDDYDSIAGALAGGTLTLARLQENARMILGTLLRLQVR